jgi:hypothetical protein
VQPVRPGEPLRLHVVRSQLERGAAVGHERPLAVGRNHDPDAAGPRPSHADGPDLHAVTAHGLDERAAHRIPADRGDQCRSRPEPPEPARRVRRRSTLDERDPAGHVGATLEDAGRRQDDIEQEVAQDDDARRARGGAAGGAARSARSWGVQRRHGSRG